MYSCNGTLTDYFNSYKGVKQGEPLSPILFLFFINDMYNALYDDHVDVFSIDDIQLFMLLFADDTVLFSYTIEGLQALLDKLKTYCDKWGIEVNIDKTVSMVFKKGNRVENVELYYNNVRLKNVRKFTYLGVRLTSNGIFLQTQKALSEQARKAMFSLFSLFDMVSLNVSEKLKMFDAMISPILNYGAEIWGFHKSVDIERLHLKFLKLKLHVKPQTMDYIVYGELGRVPMAIIRKIRILKYWTRIIQDKNSLMYKLYSSKDCNGNYINPWTINVQNLFNDIGFAYIFKNQAISQIEFSHVKKRLYDNYLQKWSNNISVLS